MLSESMNTAMLTRSCWGKTDSFRCGSRPRGGGMPPGRAAQSAAAGWDQPECAAIEAPAFSPWRLHCTADSSLITMIHAYSRRCERRWRLRHGPDDPREGAALQQLPALA